MSDQNLYEVGYADLQRADITSDVLNRIVARYTYNMQAQGGVGMSTDSSEIAALLAAILKNQVPANCRYNVYPFQYVTVTDAVTFQIVPQNLGRKFLAVQVTAGTISTRLLFQEASVTPQDITSDQSDALSSRGLVVLSSDLLQFNPPSNSAISLVSNLGVGGFLSGILIEGV